MLPLLLIPAILILYYNTEYMIGGGGSTTVVMVRHGQAQHNVDRSIKDEESSLTEKGIEQAETTGKYLSA